MLHGSSRARNREVARDQIINYLTTNNIEMMKYETVRKNINKNYSDQYLENLIEHFPNEVRNAKLKGDRSGIARITESNQDASVS